MSEHKGATPGPWKWDVGGIIETDWPAHGPAFHIATVNMGEDLISDPDLDTACKNAVLIASAPELKEATMRMQVALHECRLLLLDLRDTDEVTPDLRTRMRMALDNIDHALQGENDGQPPRSEPTNEG